MYYLFCDLYQEELRLKGRINLTFWIVQVRDIIKSVIEQHIYMINKYGFKKYFQTILQINKYNVIGGIFLLPAGLVFLIDLVSRIIQGDLIHYNRPVYAFMSHTPLYWQPVLFTWVFILPILAVLINFVPLVKALIKKHRSIKSWSFLIQNLITVLLLGFGIFIILLVRFHDVGPCMLHGLARLGFEHFTDIVAVCKNA